MRQPFKTSKIFDFAEAFCKYEGCEPINRCYLNRRRMPRVGSGPKLLEKPLSRICFLRFRFPKARCGPGGGCMSTELYGLRRNPVRAPSNKVEPASSKKKKAKWFVLRQVLASSFIQVP